jgi:hypothetical protein
VPWTIYGYVVGEVLQAFLLGVLAISLLHATLAAYQTVRSGLQLSFVWPLVASTLAYPLYFSIPISLLFRSDTRRRAHGQRSGGDGVPHARHISHSRLQPRCLRSGSASPGLSFYLNGWVIPAFTTSAATCRRTC